MRAVSAVISHKTRTQAEGFVKALGVVEVRGCERKRAACMAHLHMWYYIM